MKIQTMSVVVGTSACNAKCPFCVSKTTHSADLPTHPNWRNFKKACQLAKIGGATTVLLTGKGEPTLYPELIDDYLIELQKEDFPFIELQTNGIGIDSGGGPTGIGIDSGSLDEWLPLWYKRGLNTICLSAVHYEQEPNFIVYSPKYPRLEDTVKKLHYFGYTVRLSIMMMKGGIDNPLAISNLINFCKDNKIKQLTVRPLSYPEKATSDEAKWAKEHTLDDSKLEEIKEWLDKNTTPVLHLAHGATVYDALGQNICLTNCLTTNETTDDMRQVIYFPNGTISYDWKYKGAVLL